MHRKLAGGRVVGAARKRVADLSFKEAEALQTVGVCGVGGALWPRGPSGVSSLIPHQFLSTTVACEDQPKQDMETGGGCGERGMKEEGKMRSNSGASLFTLCPPLLLRTVSQQPIPSYFRTEENVFLGLSEK